eukprot:TRINITY_DN1407_c1_g1_i1.p1 TRINITY_DN1407_c1_g1~~TRINITY_DN1407_c1_g1_i1.p1  ORF type:complete len:1234 (+),score=376.93 TRINITY_DN1407_c1_g1_i1:156-3857(+)
MEKSEIRVPVRLEKRGYLIKKGRKRWFFLTNGILYWFNREQSADTNDVKKRANGNIQLGSRISVFAETEGKKPSIRICGSERGEYTLIASDEDERDSWVRCLQAAIDLFKSTSDKNFEMQGYLTKRGKRFFFRVQKDYLLWFQSEKESKFLGSLSLTGCTAELKDDRSSVILLSNGEDQAIELTAKSMDYAVDWIRQISNTSKKLQLTPHGMYCQEKSWKIRVELGPVSAIVQSDQNGEKCKELLLIRYNGQNLSGDSPALSDHFIFRIKGTNHYLIDDRSPLSSLHVVQLCRKAFAVPIFEMVSKTKLIEDGVSLKELLLEDRNRTFPSETQDESDLATLVGDSLTNTLASKNDRAGEVCCFRRDMARFRIAEFENIRDRLPEYLESEPLPKIIPTSVTITCNVPGDSQKTIVCDVNITVEELKWTLLEKFKRIDFKKTMNKSIRNYLLKVAGFRSYFDTNEKSLIDYDYIRFCINKEEKIVLSLVDFNSISHRENVSLVDKVLAVEGENDLDEKPANLDILPNTDIMSGFRIKINSVRNIFREDLTEDTTMKAYVLVELYHGGALIDDQLTTKTVSYRHSIIPAIQETNAPVWNQWVAFSLPLYSIPKATRVCFTVYIHREGTEESPLPIGWVAYQLVDHKSRLVTTPKTLKLWLTGKANPIGMCTENLSAQNPTTISLEFEKYSKIIEFCDPQSPMITSKEEEPPHDEKKSLEELILRDSLAVIKNSEMRLLWTFRYYVCRFSSALPKFLRSIDWAKPDQVGEAHRLLDLWSQPTPIQALQLLGSSFADAKVRGYAVKCISTLNDGDLADLLLQLTQVLKYEPYHDSALARFLLHRALNNKDLIGHRFFWNLKSEMHIPEIAERYGLLLETYLRGCGGIYRTELFKQCEIVEKLQNIALKIKGIPKKDERQEQLKVMLRRIDFPERFQLPIFTNVECKGLIIDKCKVMTSKKLPMRLVFENADRNGAPITVIFKCGDDLRQDVLTLQMIKLMDKLWIKEGFQLRMSPYNVISTGLDVGMVEVVLNSETIASINRDAGGGRSVLVKDTVSKWLKSINEAESDYLSAVMNFALSCAGYCVCTYVIGIGDRHNDNIMLSERGNLFHIDFGHFLGHFKTKFGFEREKAPFVFTPQFAHILGGRGSPMYQFFENTCCSAYNIVRKNSELFINLFSMMLSVGLPELQSVENIMFLRDQLYLDKPDDAASAHFKALIEESLTTKTQQLMDMVHIWAN